MGREKFRRRGHCAGPITIGANADAGIARLGANVIGPISGDTLGVSEGTAVLGTADLHGINGALHIGALSTAATPSLAFRHNGTVFALFFATAGGTVTGTPVT